MILVYFRYITRYSTCKLTTGSKHNCQNMNSYYMPSLFYLFQNPCTHNSIKTVVDTSYNTY